MLLMAERSGEQHNAKHAKVIEHIGGYYETQEVPFGVVYQWHPGYLLIECACGERLALTPSRAAAASVEQTTQPWSKKS